MKNNFDLLRLLLAVQVAMIHIMVFCHAGDSLLRHWLLNPTNASPVAVAVQCFFVISGFLIYASWMRCRTLGEYAAKRCRRIYPAYLAAVFLSVAAAWACFDGSTEFWSYDVARYVVGHLFFLTNLQNTLPGVYSNHPTDYMNGALWTLKVEVLFYCALPPVAWMLRRTKPWVVFTLLYIASESFFAWCLSQDAHSAAQRWAAQLPGQFAFFVVGMAGWHYRDQFRSHAKKIVLISAIGYAVAEAFGLAFLRPLSLGGIVLYFATCFPYLGNAGRYGDFSYGIYIYHFPVLHVLYQYGVIDISPVVGTVAALAATFLAAWLSWRLIEKPFLLGSSHYRQAEGTE